MNMKKFTINFWARLLSVVLIVSMASGYVYSPAVAGAETDNEITMEVSAGEILSAANETTVSEEENIPETTIAGNVDGENETTESGDEEPTSGTNPEESTTEEVTTVDPDAYTLIGHRGYSGYAPENSIPALEMAVAAGFDTIELDVRRCKPDANGSVKWVIAHDDSLSKTMGVDLKISELTYSQILQYSYTKGNRIEDYKNLKIATLDEVIELIKASKAEGKKIIWQIELKDTDIVNYTDYFEEELIKPIVEAQVQDCVMFSSFNATYLKKIKDIDSSYRTWFLSTILNETAISRAKNCQAEGISFKGAANHTAKDSIEAALNDGLRLGVYTVNSPVVMGVYYQWGVRNFSTDEVAPNDLHRDMLAGTYNVRAFTINLGKNSFVYNGTRRLPKVTVLYKGVELVEGLNYELSYENNKNPGTATVYISGVNNCVDEKKTTFEITMPEVEKFEIKSSKAKNVKLSWSAVEDVSGYIVYSYNFTTKKYEEVKTINNPATITCKVKKLQPATKYKFRVKAYVNTDGNTYLSSASSAKTTYTKPAKAKIKSVTRYKDYKRLKVKWNAVQGCTGYEVKIATDKKMKNVIGTYTVKGSKKLKLKIKKLAKKQKYYVKVRAYLKGGKTTYYGAYSSVVKSAGKPKKKK